MHFTSKQLIFFAVLAALLFGSVSSMAQSRKGDRSSRTSEEAIDLRNGVSFEISPHTGAMGGSGIFGLRASMNYGTLNMEVSIAQAIGQSANLYPLTVNGLLNISTRGKLLPYGLIGGGLFLTKPTNAVGAGTVSSMGVNFGAGARYYVNSTFGFRVEARQYLTNVNNRLEDVSELVSFQEISVGVTFMLR